MRARGRHHPHKKGGKHGFFAKQWVWFALALVIGEALEATVFTGAPAWLSVPGLVLIGYGYQKKKPGAVNAGLALMGWKLASNFGVTGMIKSVVKNGFKLTSTPTSSGGGGGSSGGSGNDFQDVQQAIDLYNQLSQVA